MRKREKKQEVKETESDKLMPPNQEKQEYYEAKRAKREPTKMEE